MCPVLFQIVGGGGPPKPPSDPREQEQEQEEIVLGSRILGGVAGGSLGNGLQSGLRRTGLASCTPFNPEGCAAVKAAHVIAQSV